VSSWREARHIDRLVKRAIKGDADAFGSIFDHYADRVYAFVRARTSSHQDAEDITGTVFLKAFEAVSEYRQQGFGFGAWLFRIAHNTIIDHYRKAGRLPEPVEDIEFYPIQDPVLLDELVVARVDAEMIKALILNLTHDQAAVIVARFFWDMDVRTTARSLGRTEGSVKALQHRAMRRLADMIEESVEDEG